ncbi:hypothetical protein [Winogradskyella tangerina]|uniref:hypothetical protein n=1 Tax=Winogradskyella tangerina TaxID=2023240 RepID=UPI000DBDFFEA|nr:hypothetical protein [Winogradskyella tangerina]
MKIIGNNLYNKSVYDSENSKKNKVKIVLSNEILKINYNKIIDTFFTQGNIEDESLKQDLLNLFSLGKYSKAPCGGFVNFFEVLSNNANKYAIYSGIREVSNSYFKVEIHEIIKI